VRAPPRLEQQSQGAESGKEKKKMDSKKNGESELEEKTGQRFLLSFFTFSHPATFHLLLPLHTR